MLRPLARGGMAEVLLAESEDLPGLRRVVVIKRILPELGREPGYARMFLDEARIVAGLSHPNVVQIVEVGRDGEDLFLAMEHIDGPSLAAVLEAAAARDEPLPYDVALYIAGEVLAGLHYVHERRDEAGRPLQLIHRDVTPRNVLLTRQGAVKLIDFGIARPANRLGLTRDGRVRGTVPYMSPEQCRGRQLDRRSDVYSAGILLWELTVGRRLYDGESEFAIFEQIVHGAPPAPRSLREGYPEALEAVTLRALRREPAERFASAGEMLDALEAAGRALGLQPSARTLEAYLRAQGPLEASAATRAQTAETAEAPGPRNAETAETAEALAAQRPQAPAPTSEAPPLAPVDLAEVRPSSPGSGPAMALAASAASEEIERPVRRRGPALAAAGLLALLGAGGVAAWRLGAAGGGRTAQVPRIPGDAPDAGPAKSAVAATPPAADAGSEALTPAPDASPSPAAPSPAAAERHRAAPSPAAERHPATPPPAAAERRPATPRATTGELVLEAVPWCQVSIDGQERGTTPLILQLPPGPHQVRLRNAEYAIDREARVVVAAGRSVRRRFDFPTAPTRPDP